MNEQLRICLGLKSGSSSDGNGNSNSYQWPFQAANPDRDLINCQINGNMKPYDPKLWEKTEDLFKYWFGESFC